jgi:release factor glutamine methyltransferase
VAILSLEDYLLAFFKAENKSLLFHYPGLTLHRLRNDLTLHASLNGMQSDELFDLPYLPYRSHPITLFFEKLKTGIPLEYITGQAYFYRSSFKVTPDVLIPRSETEILVEMAIMEMKKNYHHKKCRIADVGTGSGVIALTLMMEDCATLDVVASDISDKALAIARENFFNLKFMFSPSHSIKLIKSDRLQNIEGEFDLILSNPPYIKRLSDSETVHQQVERFEPALALYLDDDVYDVWFEDFFKSLFQKLKGDGMSLIEGHEEHLEGLKSVAQNVGFGKVDVIKDYTGRNRFLRLKKA